VYQDILFETDRELEQIMREHTWRGWFTAQPEPSEGIGCLVVSSGDMMKLETIEFFLQPPYLLPVCCHAGVTIVRLSHYLIDDELRVFTDVKLKVHLDPLVGFSASMTKRIKS
jgi:hypothetical protein